MSVRPEKESPYVPEALLTSAHVGLKKVLKISTEKSVQFHEIGGTIITEHDFGYEPSAISVLRCFKCWFINFVLRKKCILKRFCLLKNIIEIKMRSREAMKQIRVEKRKVIKQTYLKMYSES